MAQEQWRRRSGKFPSGDGMVVTLLYTSVSVWLAFEPTPVVQDLASSLVALFFVAYSLHQFFFLFVVWCCCFSIFWFVVFLVAVGR